ncbi:O-linked N-acetylglucosamine transferase family protein [Geomesophilobacter sediminis]|uniref:protein O-GlcNAc transferase n=1 Tax=Geomesophilobacter sediminis TaxID=2798584 RepID=A0A8J7M304_9BACT|nr:tetratricopeptide repeat protein [Geomesophilobacter sediminis]MBJ6727760.1 tetratricopeptide repeat protein [Geomesophilobacter sediminis]
MNKLDKTLNEATALQQAGRFKDAEKLFLKVLKARPNDLVAIYSLAVTAAKFKEREKALSYFDRAAQLNPSYGPTWYNRGLVLQELNRHDEAVESYQRAVQLDPGDFGSLYSLGVIASLRGDQATALDYMERSLKINDAFPWTWYSRGVIFHLLHKNSEALECFERTLKLDPTFIRAMINRGSVLEELGRHSEAVENYDRLLAIEPDNQMALGNRGIILTELNRYEEAVADFQRLLALNPDYDYAWGLLYFAQLYICRWEHLPEYLPHIEEGVARGKRVCKSLPLLSVSDNSLDHLRCSRIFAAQHAPARQNAWTGPTYRHDKIRIAYVSPDLREHPVGHLTAGIFENHDRSRFETIAISLDGGDQSKLHQRMVAAFDRFVYVNEMSSEEIANLMRSLEVDIAIDLAGYTANSRPDIFTYRPAPIQATYLGYPSTTGLDCIDYIIADHTIIPEENRPFFSEKVAYLPDTYLPTDATLKVAEKTPSRKACGLPEKGFVFCSFNHSYKINPTIFGVWMRILKRTPGSVLWLMKLNPVAEVNLRKEAEAAGVDPSRLIFATRVPKVEDHLARYRNAGVFLDTTPYNAHTTASDALFVGLPVLTCLGKAFPGRVAASLLNAVGMPELIAADLKEYEELAVRLAEDAALLTGLKEKLAANRGSYPLFDTAGFCRNLEAAYLEMWERHQRGTAPESFSVPAPAGRAIPAVSGTPAKAAGTASGVAPAPPTREIERIIAPEIKDDEMHQMIVELAQRPDVKTILEIGSSAGGGSTSAFVAGLLRNPVRPTLYCMEVSGPRFEVLAGTYREIPEVRCYRASSVPRERFPSEEQVRDFYRTTRTNLNAYPEDEIVRWLRQDLEYIAEAKVNEEGIRTIKRENNIDTFDMVLIDGSEFTGEAELEEVYGARFILLDDTVAYKNWATYHRLAKDPNYRLLRENHRLRNGYAVFERVTPALRPQPNPELPVHFFTIVLNGEPFIRYHLDVFRSLPFDWHWHIVEGVADLKHDTAWSVRNGGRIDGSFHDNGVSNDGTTQYLDELQKRYPDRITVYRKPAGTFWDGKLEMVNAPLGRISEECLLWQVDVDEFWTFEQICTAREMFLDAPERRAAFYWCRFFVGPELMVNSRYCYSQNPTFEWQRTWRYTPGCRWSSHEPPQLVEPQATGAARPLAEMSPFMHAETERKGLVFQHFAYVLPEQLSFKESYYGYKGAVKSWKKLQQQSRFPVPLKDYFGWVHDGTTVDRTLAQGVLPMPLPAQGKGGLDRFKVVLDGVFLQQYRTGIARVWLSLLQQWAGTAFADHLVILDRDGTFPRVDGFNYRVVPRHDYGTLAEDRKMLQNVCDEEGAALFVSTYFSHPLTTPALQMAHDMIPELLRFPAHPMWDEKKAAIEYASAFVAVSENTALDLARLYPRAAAAGVTVAHNGIDPGFGPATAEEVASFRSRFQLEGGYFLHVGARGTYKNVGALFKALAALPGGEGIKVVCTGRAPLEPELAALLPPSRIVMAGELDDAGLRAAYSGALALVYPSFIEGFGLPLVEAMACGCPVITGRHPVLREVSGDAALYVTCDDIDEIVKSMLSVEAPKLRELLVARGLRRARHFSWERMAREVLRACGRAAGLTQWECAALEARKKHPAQGAGAAVAAGGTGAGCYAP